MVSRPSVARATSMSTLQSSPITLATELPICSSLPVPPLAWKMTGTCGYFWRSAAATRSAYGQLQGVDAAGYEGGGKG
eukprot:264404-Chlamydomonas_euryale.AAC.1